MTWTYGNDFAGMAKILAHAAEHGVESIEAQQDGYEEGWRLLQQHLFSCSGNCRYRIKRKPREWWLVPNDDWWSVSVIGKAIGAIHVCEVMDDE